MIVLTHPRLDRAKSKKAQSRNKAKLGYAGRMHKKTVNNVQSEWEPEGDTVDEQLRNVVSMLENDFPDRDFGDLREVMGAPSLFRNPHARLSDESLPEGQVYYGTSDSESD